MKKHGEDEGDDSDYDESIFPERGKQPRALGTTKPVVFISARVHPGETPSSYILHGLVSYLRQAKNRQAQQLLKRFTFKIVPMINPDGVYRGYFRLDIHSNNLNRLY